jgi:2-aminoadipate transaminase
MIKNWKDRFSGNCRKYEGYPIGKMLQYLSDPEIISLAGGLPSPDIFQRSGLLAASERILGSDNINKVMQYSAIPD